MGKPVERGGSFFFFVISSFIVVSQSFKILVYESILFFTSKTVIDIVKTDL